MSMKKKNLIMLLVFLFSGCSSFPSKGTRETAPEIATETDPFMFPESWLKAPFNAEATSLKSEEKERSLRILKKALEKYPPDLLAKTLKKIYVLESLVYSGGSAPSANAGNRVYLQNQGKAAGYSDCYLEGRVHVEISESLRWNFEDLFDVRAWEALRRKRINVSKADLRTYSSMTFDPKLFKEGYLTKYSIIEPGNDFSAFAESLFKGEKRLWDIAARFPKIRKKLDFVMSFYASVDKSFTESYFKGLVGLGNCSAM